MSEFASRRRIVSSGLAERKIDALLVAFSPNLRYLTGFTGSNGSLLVLADHAVLFTDPRYTIQAAEEASASRGGALRLKIVKGSLSGEVAAAIGRLGPRKIGYEPARMTCDALEALQGKLPMKAALEPVKGWVEELRMVKSASELESIRRSVRTNSRAFEQAMAHIRARHDGAGPGGRVGIPHEAAGRGKAVVRNHRGSRGALRAAARAAHRRGAARGDLVVIDMGAFQDGYASDMTRMLFLGAPGPVKRAYRAVLEAQLAAIDAVRPGRHGGTRGSRRALGVRSGMAWTAPLSTPPATGWAWRFTSRRASASARRRACEPAWPSLSSPASTWKAGAASASRTR